MKISIRLSLFCLLHYVTIHTMQLPKRNNQQEQKHIIKLHYPWEQTKDGVWEYNSPLKYYISTGKSNPKRIDNIALSQSKINHQSNK